MGRTQLAYEVNLTDIDAELERGRRHHRLQLSVLETPFGVKPLLLGEAAVMRSHAVFAEAVGKFTRHAFDHATRVHEDERGAMAFDQLGQAVIDLIPNFRRHDRFQR